jgi:hypothetical protein
VNWLATGKFRFPIPRDAPLRWADNREEMPEEEEPEEDLEETRDAVPDDTHRPA